jgi:hypothetical protein
VVTATYSSLNTGLTSANAGAIGDEFLMKDGAYDLPDIQALSKSGIKFKAEHEGMASIIGGAIDLKGSDIEFSGFDLQFANTREQVMYILGNNCKFLKNNTHFKNSLGTTSRQDWINVKGTGNIIQYNDVHGKTGRGNFVLIGTGSLLAPQNKILDNKLHDFKVTNYGSTTNGYEVARVGSSTAANKDFYAEIARNNIYDISSPETELITIKGSNNDVHDNVIGMDPSGAIKSVSASMCLRHGRLNKVNNNKFYGSGLRIYGRGHEVIGNTFKRNSLNQLRQIVVGNGRYAEEEQNMASGDANYTQVRDLKFQNNWIEMEDSTDLTIFYWNYGSESLKPFNNTVSGNTIFAKKGVLANAPNSADWNDNSISGNKLWCVVGGVAKYGNMPISGYTKSDPTTVTPTPTPEPTPLTIEERVKLLESDMTMVKQKLGLV